MCPNKLVYTKVSYRGKKTGIVFYRVDLLNLEAKKK
jgi:hypothetical protein